MFGIPQDLMPRRSSLCQCNSKAVPRIKASLPLFREVWDLEVEAIEHMEDLVDLLEVTRLYWEPDQGLFIFERDRDLERFNAINKKIASDYPYSVDNMGSRWTLIHPIKCFSHKGSPTISYKILSSHW